MSDAAIAQRIGWIVGNLGAVFFVVAAIVAFVRVRRARAFAKPIDAAEVFWRELLFFAVGIPFMWYGLLHAFFQGLAQQYIGWAPSPFEYELGFAEVGIGIVAILGRFRSYDMGLAATIAFGVFSFAAAAQHIRDIVCCANTHPGNAGGIVWLGDIALPLVMIGLAWRVGLRARRSTAYDELGARARVGRS